MAIDERVALDPSPDGPLYHYTSLAAFQSILKEKALWASHVNYLNDAAEIRYAIDVLNRQLAQLRNLSRGRNGRQRVVCIDQLESWLSLGTFRKHLLFLCSFTEKGNLLSQWRGYCPPGGGVSFGISAEDLQDASDVQGFYLTRCLYSSDEQLSVLEGLLRLLVVTAEDLAPDVKKERHPTQRYFPAFERHEDLLLRTAARIKHPAFAEEAEWRAVSMVGRDFADREVKLRTNGKTLVPYKAFRLPANDRGGVAVHQVFVGPTQALEESMHSLDLLLTQERGCPRAGLHASGIPWRDW